MRRGHLIMGCGLEKGRRVPATGGRGCQMKGRVPAAGGRVPAAVGVADQLHALCGPGGEVADGQVQGVEQRQQRPAGVLLEVQPQVLVHACNGRLQVPHRLGQPVHLPLQPLHPVPSLPPLQGRSLSHA
ncbi:hypothetical protein ANANG_G00168190, partial [Anguilla anguilla]